MPQLDALRAIAVVMVIWSHWSGYHNNLWEDTFWFNGQIGVQLFFVLSGFLITGILLKERDRGSQLRIPRSEILKVFYVRRVLRIFPLFYLTLLITYLLNQPDVVHTIKWHVLYLTNVLFAVGGEYQDTVAHFWSLAVEEQFYLFWPLLMLYIPKRYLFITICITITIAPVFRFVGAYGFDWNDVTVNVITFSSLDALGLGGLFAYLREYSTGRNVKALRILLYFCLACLLLFFFFKRAPIGLSYETREFMTRLVLAPALLVPVWLGARGVSGFVGKLLTLKPFLYIGKISYGIYILHFFIPYYTFKIFHDSGFLFWNEIGVIPYLALNIILLISLCSISWYLIETPLINLKRFFPYGKRRVVLSN